MAIFVMISLFAFVESYSFGAVNYVCDSSPDKVHHFDGHRSLNYGYSVDLGYHSYVYGYEGNTPVYHNDCHLTQTYYYCERYCIYCNTPQTGSVHSEPGTLIHSVNHN